MKVNIIGSGNVAFHLLKAFRDAGLEDVYSVEPHSLQGLHTDSDVSLIAVSDAAIPEVIAHLPEMKGIIAHTSGSTPLSVFEESGIRNFGVFYPMQTFSKSKPLDYKKIPFYVEGSDKEAAQTLFILASIISPIVRYADSLQRRALHIAAVLSCNFVNHLWTLSSLFLKENGLDFADFLPLIEETLDKVKTLSPKEAQTGPAVRGDMNIVHSHLDLLNDKPHIKEIYRLLSESIYNIHHNHE